MTEDSTAGLQAVVFYAGGTAFGADIRDVREIIRLSSITAIPGTAGHMEGITSVRGEIVPLLSLRSLAGVPQCEHDSDTRVLILDRLPPLGLIVDSVGEVKSIPGNAIEPVPSFGSTADNGSLYRGIAKLQDRMIILMDLKKIMASADVETAACPPAPAGDGPADNACVTADAPMKLTEFQMDALRELGNIGTLHSATALSQLVGRDIHITVPAISLERIVNIPAIISNDRVVGLLLEIKYGDRMIGYLYTIFSEKSASNIADTLLGQAPGTTTVIGEMEQSAIMEVGNILASSFCDAIAEFLGIPLLPSPPAFINDMACAVIQSSLIEICTIADDAILFRTDFTDDQSVFEGYVILLPNPDMLGRMMSILDAKVNPGKDRAPV